MYKRVCLCVLVHVNKTVYLLPMKGVFAWTNPQLIFLFELLQAHCTNLKEIGGVRRCFLYKAMHHFSFVLVKRTNTHTKKTKNFYQQHQKLNKNPPQNSLKKKPKTTEKSPTDQLCLLYNSDATLMGTCSVRGQEATHYSSFGFPLFNRKTINTVMQMVRDYQFISGVVS